MTNIESSEEKAIILPLVTCKSNDLHYISLAYYNLEVLPAKLAHYLGEGTQMLDLSNNDFKDLSFLNCFGNLRTLILDRNPNPDLSTFPDLPNLEILWLNNCNIVNVSDWLYMLKVRCPVLKQLSMMNNPVGATTLNGVTEYDELQYRKNILKILPNLIYFDGSPVTNEQRMPSDDVDNISGKFCNTLGKIVLSKLYKMFPFPH